jgi:hypothetical protein
VTKSKLNYRFHDPNATEVTADNLIRVLLEANREKAEIALREATKKSSEPVRKLRLANS